MIKVENGAATREPIPDFLDRSGTPEALASLLDLSWTDPTFGLLDAAWWPEEDVSGELGTNKKWGAEVFTLDTERKVVLVNREQLDLTAEDLAAQLAQQTATAYAERDRLMAWATTRIAPLQDAVDIDDASAAEIALLKKWKQYRVALNRIQDQAGFPPDIVWPEAPE